MIKETLEEVFSVILFVMTVTLLILIIGVGFAMSATTVDGKICLSKKEARQLWPKAHIYWYSKHRCWSNRRGPPRHLKMDPIINSHADATTEFSFRGVNGGGREAVSPPLSSEDKCCWPDLDRDASGNVVEPPRAFSDRWNDQPWIGRMGQ